MYESRAYDKHNNDGFGPEPVVVLVVTGTHDVSRLVNTLMGACPPIELIGVGQKVLRQVQRHNGGQAALRLLAEHGGPNFAREPRVWRHNDPQPAVAVNVRDIHGDIWSPRDRGPNDRIWETPETAPFRWDYVLKKWGPLTEVTADELEAHRVALANAYLRARDLTEPYDDEDEDEFEFEFEDDGREYVVVRGEHRPVEDVHLPEPEES